MWPTRRCSLLALVACLMLPAAGLAAPAGAPAPEFDSHPGGAALSPGVVPLAAAVQPTAPAQAPVVYLVQAPAAPAAPAESGLVGVLKSVSVETWALLLGLIVMVVLQLLGQRAAGVRGKVDYWIDVAYGIAEAAARSSAPGSALSKLPAALDAFHRGLMGEGIKPSGADVARAQAAWTARAAQEKVEADIRAKAAAKAAAEAKPAGAGAVLDEAARA